MSYYRVAMFAHLLFTSMSTTLLASLYAWLTCTHACPTMVTSCRTVAVATWQGAAPP